jgi:lipoprotein NlpI
MSVANKHSLRLVAVGLALYSATVMAESGDRWQMHVFYGTRAEARGHYGDAINSYSAAIKAGGHHGEPYLLRARAFYVLGEYDDAIDDLDHAIALDPEKKIAFFMRANAHYAKHEYPRAIEDYTAFIQSAPQKYLGDALDYRGRSYYALGECTKASAELSSAVQRRTDNPWTRFRHGLARYCLGDYAAAASDFRAALAAPAPQNYYAAIWLYLAEARTDDQPREHLAANAESLKLESWPGPIIAMFLNRLTPKELLDLEVGDDAKSKKQALCEKLFFIGQHYALAGQADLAERYFKETVDTGVLGYIEYQAAQIELRK